MQVVDEMVEVHEACEVVPHEVLRVDAVIEAHEVHEVCGFR